jgi:hypothetical protein
VELQRVETQHNTDDQVRGYVEQAQAIADWHGIDREREPLVFCKLLDLVSTKQITVVQGPGLGVVPGLPESMRH